MSRKKLIRSASALGVILSVTGVVAAANATQSEYSPSGPSEVIARSSDDAPGYEVRLSALGSTAIPSINHETYKRFAAMYPGQLRHQESGKTLIDDRDGYRVAVIEDTAENTCATLDSEKELMTATCTPALPASGVQINVRTETDQPILIWGLATDGVSAVTVETVDGHRTAVPISNQAFLWIAPDSTTRLAAIESTRFGIVTRDDNLATPVGQDR